MKKLFLLVILSLSINTYGQEIEEITVKGSYIRYKSEKIRLEDNKLIHPLNRETRGEASQFDTVSNDSNRLGIFFSPQDMINKDINLQ